MWKPKSHKSIKEYNDDNKMIYATIAVNCWGFPSKLNNKYIK